MKIIKLLYYTSRHKFLRVIITATMIYFGIILCIVVAAHLIALAESFVRWELVFNELYRDFDFKDFRLLTVMLIVVSFAISLSTVYDD